MKTSLFATILFAAALIASPLFTQSPAPSPAAGLSPIATQPTAPAGQPSAEDMQKMMQQMMEMAKPGENQKLLADTAGSWSYTVKMWMNPDPNAKAQESKGSAVRKMIMEGRYLTGDYTGKMEMPGPGGKKKEMTFHGTGIEAYDNVKKKFVSSWIDNMGTGIMYIEGDYDLATKAFTYRGEMEPMPGMKTKVREVLKVVDKDHMNFEWYEVRGGQEAKTMEINYTRKK